VLKLVYAQEEHDHCQAGLHFLLWLALTCPAESHAPEESVQLLVPPYSLQNVSMLLSASIRVVKLVCNELLGYRNMHRTETQQTKTKQ